MRFWNDEYVGHFWPDVKREPVVISLNEKLNDFVGECLAKAVPIHTLFVCTPVDDQSLDHITTLNANGGRAADLLIATAVSRVGGVPM